MFTRNLVLFFLLTVHATIVLSLPQGRETNVTLEESEESNSTEIQLVGEHGLLWSGLEYFLGDNGNKLLFHEDSPIQYAANFDYLPLVSSITTILDFIASEQSPGYVLATYDYAQFLSRLSPIGHIADQYTSGAIKTAILLVSSILSGYAIVLVIAYGVKYMMTQLEAEDTEADGRSGGRSLKHLHREAEEVLTAGQNIQVEDSQRVINWLSNLVSQYKAQSDQTSY